MRRPLLLIVSVGVASLGAHALWSEERPQPPTAVTADAPTARGASLSPRPQEASSSPSTPAAVPPLSAPEQTRIERLLQNRIACRGCHVIDGRGGLIGPVLDGIGTRADVDYVRSVIDDPVGTIPGTIMPHQAVPAADADRLARYLVSLPSPTSPPSSQAQAPPPFDSANPDEGAALYARHCSACHGEGGGGDGWNAVNLPVQPTHHGDPSVMSSRADDTLFDGITVGGWVLGKSPMMPAFGDLLTPAQIRALVGHIRELCGCEQPAWARDGG